MTRIEQPGKMPVQGFDYYSKKNLRVYNMFVLGFNNRFVWRCPTRVIEEMFARLATSEHCDIGVGSGYFLKKQHSRQPFTALHLVDASGSAIDWVKQLFPDLLPGTTCTNVASGLSHISGPVHSISLNYLLHCMKGPLENKEPILATLGNIAPPGTIVFGSTIVNDKQHNTWLARHSQKLFNQKKVFDTSDDSQAKIAAVLTRHLSQLETTMHGSVLLFEGRIRESAEIAK